MRICHDCGVELSEDNTPSTFWNKKTKYKKNICKKCWVKECRERRRQVRIKILELLGNKCARCGYCADWRALEIDHVKGGGNEHRRKYGTSFYTMYRQILKEIKAGSKDYQCLCSNCNRIKEYEEKDKS